MTIKTIAMITLLLLVCVSCLTRQADSYVVTFERGLTTDELAATGTKAELICTISESDDFDSATTKVIISKRPAFPTDVVVAHNVSTDTTSIDPFADRYTVTSTGASPEDVVYTLTIETLEDGDSAQYSCIVGMMTAQVDLQVARKPTKVELVWVDPMAPAGNDTGSTGNASANLFGNELDWSVALAGNDTEDTAGDGNVTTVVELPKKIVHGITETFVGCYVDGGYPKPDIKLMIGSKELPASNQDEQTTYIGDVGFEVPTFLQRRTMNVLFGWMHNARAVKCVGTIGRSDLDLADSILLSIQAKPGIMLTMCKDIVLSLSEVPDAVICAIYCNPGCTAFNIADHSGGTVVSIDLSLMQNTYEKDGIEASVAEQTDFVYDDAEYGQITYPTGVFVLKLMLPLEKKYFMDYLFSATNDEGTSDHVVHLTLGISGGTLDPGDSTDKGATTEKAASKSGSLVLIIGIVVALLVVGGIVAAIFLSQKKKTPEDASRHPPAAQPPPAAKPEDVKVDVPDEEEMEEEGGDEEEAEEEEMGEGGEEAVGGDEEAPAEDAPPPDE